jgi:hypothetical protein
MVNIKVVVLLLATSVLVAVVAGIAFAQYASAQAGANGNFSQTPQGTFVGYNQYPQQGYPYGPTQYGSSYGYGRGMGMGMCGRTW